MSGVLVDTCIWSRAFRSKTPKNDPIVQQFTQLIDENRARIIGVIRQELLSGYSDMQRYKKLRSKMQWFPNEQMLDEDYETAARFSNRCRKKGIQGSHIDYLICAVAQRLDLHIFSVDQDFEHYAKHLPITLLSPST